MLKYQINELQHETEQFNNCSLMVNLLIWEITCVLVNRTYWCLHHSLTLPPQVPLCYCFGKRRVTVECRKAREINMLNIVQKYRHSLERAKKSAKKNTVQLRVAVDPRCLCFSCHWVSAFVHILSNIAICLNFRHTSASLFFLTRSWSKSLLPERTQMSDLTWVDIWRKSCILSFL